MGKYVHVPAGRPGAADVARPRPRRTPGPAGRALRRSSRPALRGGPQPSSSRPARFRDAGRTRARWGCDSAVLRRRRDLARLLRESGFTAHQGSGRSLTAVATRWSGGWELEIDGEHHTRVSALSRARQQVVDYLDTPDEGTGHSAWQIDVVPGVTGFAAVKAARQAVADAKAAQARAAAASPSSSTPEKVPARRAACGRLVT